jgi:hypothetical protein
MAARSGRFEARLAPSIRAIFIENAACSMPLKGRGAIGGFFCRAAAGRLLWAEQLYLSLPLITEAQAVTAQTKLSQLPPVNPEARSSVSTREAKVAGPSVYWGDRLTLKFWLFCFGLMMAMNLVEALHRLVLFLVDLSPAP